jgi:hypothetical protein
MSTWEKIWRTALGVVAVVAFLYLLWANANLPYD